MLCSSLKLFKSKFEKDEFYVGLMLKYRIQKKIQLWEIFKIPGNSHGVLQDGPGWWIPDQEQGFPVALTVVLLQSFVFFF